MKKMLMMALAVILVVVISVSGTMAYFTDTEAVVNTFTVGNIDITLDEKEDEDGDGKVTFENILPGQTYDKHPVVTVLKDSEKCYVFVKVENGLKDIETKTAADTIDGQLKAKNWIVLDADKQPGVYYKVVEKSAVDQPFAVFESFTVREDAKNADMQAVDNKTIEITAYAVQAAGIDTAADAWTIAQNAEQYGA
ncbi:MAG: hypothetical protein IJE09_04220 [Oscillospiraceae bacterium]|nr:hypothetical protein [Oscillospiraceae bacterium]